MGPERCPRSDLPAFPFCLLSPRLEAEEASNQEMPVDTDFSVLSPNKSLLSPSLGLGKGRPSKTEKLIAQEKPCSRPHPPPAEAQWPPGFPLPLGCNAAPEPAHQGGIREGQVGSCDFHPCWLVRTPLPPRVVLLETLQRGAWMPTLTQWDRGASPVPVKICQRRFS